VITAPELIQLLFTSAYADSVPIFALWSVVTVFAVWQTDAVLRVFARTRLLFVTNVVRVLVTVASFKPLLDAFGLPGAALATVLGTAAAKGIALWHIRCLIQVGWSRLLAPRDLAAVTAAASLAALVSWFCKGWFDSSTARLLVSAAVCGASFLGLVAALGLVPSKLGWTRRAGVVRS
jgi:O-antigen/teichoic acid export membrane protein